jgi:hypothetical protein
MNIFAENAKAHETAQRLDRQFCGDFIAISVGLAWARPPYVGGEWSTSDTEEFFRNVASELTGGNGYFNDTKRFVAIATQVYENAALIAEYDES